MVNIKSIKHQEGIQDTFHKLILGYVIYPTILRECEEGKEQKHLQV